LPYVRKRRDIMFHSEKEKRLTVREGRGGVADLERKAGRLKNWRKEEQVSQRNRKSRQRRGRPGRSF